MAEKSVKARARTGTSSLDLTIPKSLVEEFDIRPGDLFIVTATGGEELAIHYRRVYSISE